MVIIKMKENITLYYFQGLASILVVFIHIPFPGALGTVVTAWARIAVPLFFMISGYSLYDHIGTAQFREKIIQRIKRNGAITVIGLVIYFLVDITKCILKRESIWTFLGPAFSLPNLIKFFTLGVIPPGTGGVLWFMVGMVYSYVLLLFIEPWLRKQNIKALGIGAFLFMAFLGLVKIIATAFEAHVGSLELGSNWIYGNWITIGLPAVLIGMSLRKLIKQGTWKNYSAPAVLVIMALCLTATSIESLVLKHFFNMYLSYSVYTLIVDACIFILSQKQYFHTKNPMVKLGKYYSRDLYLWHPLVMSAISISLALFRLSDNKTVMYLQPLIVVIVSLLLSFSINKVKGRLSNG